MAGLVLALLVAIATAGLFSFRARLTSNPQVSPTPTPLTVAMQPSPSPLPSTPIPSTRPSATSRPQPTAFPIQSTDWAYPGSLSLGGGIYESSTDTDTITDWYRTKINTLGYNVKSFVKTKTNDRILNKLAAAKQGSEILVEISREPGSQTSTITIGIDNP